MYGVRVFGVNDSAEVVDKAIPNFITNVKRVYEPITISILEMSDFIFPSFD